MQGAVAEKTPSRSVRFLHGVIWSWLGVAVSIFSAFYVGAFVLHRLGHVAAGVWALVFSVLDNVWLMDLGFRSAVLKYTAHYRALGQPEMVNKTLNSGLAFSSGGCVLAMTAALFFAKAVTRFENVSPEYADVFTKLIMMVGAVWAIGALFNPLSAALEGYQRFDLSNRIWITMLTLRALGIVAVLASGRGLLAMGEVVLAAMLLNYALTFVALRRVIPQFRVSSRLVSYSVFRQMLGYAMHTFGASMGLQALNQGAPILIGHFMPSTAFVAYYTYPQRVFQYSVDMVGRVGLVTGSHTAELAAKEDYASIARLGIYVNRYCFALFAPLTIAVLAYGRQLFSVWLDPKFAAECVSILPVMALGITLAGAAQFNSSSILYGLGKHQKFAYSQMAEAALFLAGLWWAIPRYGILGAAAVSSGLMVANRGLFLSALLCRAIHFNWGKYLAGIYIAPALTAVPVYFAAAWIREHWIPGRNYFQLAAAGLMIAGMYYAIAFFTCLEPGHRSLPVRWIKDRFGGAA